MKIIARCPGTNYRDLSFTLKLLSGIQ